MAKKKWNKSRARRDKRGKDTAHPNVVVAKAPRTRLKTTLDRPKRVAIAAEGLVFGLPLPDKSTDLALVRFDLAALARGTNALKVVSTLCGDGHWEFAQGVVRQLYELVLNLEHLDALPDRLEAVVRYTNFGLLQLALRRRAEYRYNRKTHRPVDEAREAITESLLATRFTEFEGKSPGKWANSWCGKNTWELAKDSPREIRAVQYDNLFRGEWSEQAHASPGALITSIFPESDVEAIIATDDVRISETAALAVGLFIDMQAVLRAIPVLPLESRVRWMAELLDEATTYGGIPPGKPLQVEHG